MLGLHLTADLYRCRCDAAWLADGQTAQARALMTALVERFQPEWTEQRSLDRGDDQT